MSTPLESVQAAKDAIYDAKNEEDDPCDISGELDEALDALNRAESALELAARSGQEGLAVVDARTFAEGVHDDAYSRRIISQRTRDVAEQLRQSRKAMGSPTGRLKAVTPEELSQAVAELARGILPSGW